MNGFYDATGSFISNLSTSKGPSKLTNALPTFQAKNVSSVDPNQELIDNIDKLNARIDSIRNKLAEINVYHQQKNTYNTNVADSLLKFIPDQHVKVYNRYIGDFDKLIVCNNNNNNSQN